MAFYYSNLIKMAERQWHPTQVLVPGKSHGRRSLVGCRLWGRTESDSTEATQQQQQQRNNVLVQNWERSMLRLYIVTLLI